MANATEINPTQVGGHCRFYEKEFPDFEECVVVNVKSIAEMGAYVQLLEYNNIEGMILLSELSRRRIRSINKLIRVGKNEVVMVTRVDKDKGYIDLSKRRVDHADISKSEDKFNKAKAVHSILRHVSNRLKVPMFSLYKRVGWPLYKKYTHAYDAFALAVTEPDTVLKDIDISDLEKRELLEHIRTKMTPQPLKVRADIQVTNFTYQGVEAIRTALLAGQALSTNEVPIRVQLIAAPLYVMQTTTLDKTAGIDALARAIETVKASIEASGGSLIVKMAPRVTTAQDEGELARVMEGLEVDSDEEDDEDEDGENTKGAGSGSARRRKANREEDNEEGMGDADLPEDGSNIPLEDDEVARLAMHNSKTQGNGSSATSSSSTTTTTSSSAATSSTSTTTTSSSSAAAPVSEFGEESLAVDLSKKKKSKSKKSAVAVIEEED